MVGNKGEKMTRATKFKRNIPVRKNTGPTWAAKLRSGLSADFALFSANIVCCRCDRSCLHSIPGRIQPIGTNEIGDIQTAEPRHSGLTSFGKDLVRELNRLGAVIDTAHASATGNLAANSLKTDYGGPCQLC
ncbi:MAG: hypothetical protein FJ145_13495 [Deltaproteobacteria bacterium]|nr:hypothetical protein [Deltaproteobacteria bacterium]